MGPFATIQLTFFLFASPIQITISSEDTYPSSRQEIFLTRMEYLCSLPCSGKSLDLVPCSTNLAHTLRPHLFEIKFNTRGSTHSSVSSLASDVFLRVSWL
jgi:hypothetical protein